VTSANLDLVRSLYEAWEHGDYSSAHWAHPEIAFAITDGPSPGSWTGVVAMAEAWSEFLSTWEEFRTEADECRELDAERVLVLARFSARGKTSGLDAGQIQTKGATLFHVHGGKVTRLILYWDRERAFADAGVPSS
jgi:ketosteroid isomerase-like protein